MEKEPLVLADQVDPPYLYFPRWEKTGKVGHGFSTRLGGVSRGRFAGLNLGFRGEDSVSDVAENRRRFLKIWRKNEEELFSGEQVHGTNIALVDTKHLPAGGRATIPSTDALITSTPGVVLGAYSADCLLALFYDPDFPAVGVAHAGWRGTCAGILYRVVKAMHNAFFTQPQRLQVVTGPSIGRCCYEVGDEVLETCRQFSWKDELFFHPGNREGHPFLDLKRTNFNILVAAGVRPENIMLSKHCTLCRTDLFYSYRGAGGGETGSLMGLIFLQLSTG